MTFSLRSRFLIGLVVSIAFLLCAFCLVIYTATRHTLIHHFDKSLLDTAKMLSAVIEDEGFDEEEDGQKGHQDDVITGVVKPEIEFEFDVRLTPEFDNPYGGAYYQFWDVDGAAIIRSPSLVNKELNVFEEISDTPQYRECILPDGKDGRAIGFQFIPRGGRESDGTTFSVVVARDASGIYNHLNFLKLLLLTSSAMAVLLSIIIALFVARTGLRPIHILADEISSVDADNLRKSHISQKYPKELLPVVGCLNSLLQRLKLSFDREKRFSSDVAHELRTPLAGIQSTIEVCLSRVRESEEYQANLQTCLQITKSMHRMIDALLSLARLESKQASLKYECIALKNLLTDCWQNFADRAYDRRISFENRIGENVTCLSDKDLLYIILFNILDNAVEHSNEAGQIWIKAEKSTDCVTLSISNTGCMLKQQEVDNIFDSFWRGDESRKDTGKHHGIGLAVVQRLVEVLCGSVKAEIEPEQIFTIHLSLPIEKCIKSQGKDS